uniref:Golgi resident protein GCP60 n=1 Tax=Schistocephalus solidus TaxID=70667 RepID=A0A0V0J5B4_SCHSO
MLMESSPVSASLESSRPAVLDANQPPAADKPSNAAAAANVTERKDDEESDEAETQTDYEESARQEAAIRSILDQQSIIQFRQYAQEQHPKEPEKQKELIAQMQEQYFQYYIENVQHSQGIHQQRQIEQLIDLQKAARAEAAANGKELSPEDEDAIAEPIPLPLIPASLWTRKDIVEFKKEILSMQRECCIKVGSLASATLRVPTHEEGTSIFWEFATDSYDIGFGLFFEWSLSPPESITMTISESSDEEDEYEDNEEEGSEAPPRPRQRSADDGSVNGDVEGGGRDLGGPPTDELIPIYRRDSHLEVYCGSHQYPGCGVYIFKFDNSFSLWRSKWLYYRVYYGK